MFAISTYNMVASKFKLNEFSSIQTKVINIIYASPFEEELLSHPLTYKLHIIIWEFFCSNTTLSSKFKQKQNTQDKRRSAASFKKISKPAFLSHFVEENNNNKVFCWTICNMCLFVNPLHCTWHDEQRYMELKTFYSASIKLKMKEYNTKLNSILKYELHSQIVMYNTFIQPGL